ncbi:MAG: spore maturation protein [Peptococcaceae bacterium]|nr:spore maturation protein [Peptococcaceae bacterium]
MIVLLICMLIVVVGVIRKVPVFDEFVEGAKHGAMTTIRLFPFILAMILAINTLQGSGLLNVLMDRVGGGLEHFGFPKEVLPLVLLRPLTGSGSLAVTAKILEQQGPDSFIGLVASTIQGSTDTTFYIITVYFGAIGIKKIRHSLMTGLIADLAGVVAAVFVCTKLFT